MHIDTSNQCDYNIYLPSCSYLIYPHFGRDVSHISMETTILGQEINFPIGISPTGFHKLAHESGELATAKGTVHACILNL